MFQRFLMVLLFAAFGAGHAFAQANEVGRATVDGRAVILYGDRTWQFAPPPAPRAADGSCEGLVELPIAQTGMSFCLKDGDWSVDRPDGAFSAMYLYRGDISIYLGIISEPGSFSREFLRNAILEIAQGASGLTPVDLKEDKAVTIAGGEWNYLRYVARISGVDFTFFNYFRPGDGVSVQFAFWTPEESADAAAPIVDAVAQTLRLSGG